MNTIFKGLFDTANTSIISVQNFLLCLAVALVLGLLLAFFYAFRNRCSKSFAVTLAMLPAIVCVVIMMVNGNVGAGVAVAGAFSLVRFRSAPGTAKEISAIFLAMCSGLITGMGYLGYSILFTVIMCLILCLYNSFSWGTSKAAGEKTLSIYVPENLNFESAFDEVLENYTTTHEMITVKTANMGSLYKLTYRVVLKPDASEKEMIDKLRCRNGNLEISLTRKEKDVCEL